MKTTEQKHCLPCEGFGAALDKASVQKHLQELNNQWQATPDNKSIFKDFRFKNFYQTMSFVNAIAWMANTENHHPDLEVGFNHCLVRYTTHALNGLSPNDFICAKQVDSLFQPFNEKYPHDRKSI